MEKKCYKEILRIIALFWVTYNHTWTLGWVRYIEIPDLLSLEGFHNLFLHEFCKIGVPIFLMISGSNLIGKEESFKELFKKRIWRFIVVIVAIHYSVYVVLRYMGETPRLNWKELLISLYSDTTYCSYFFYMYLAFLLILPILRIIAKNEQIAKYTIILMLVFGIFPFSGLEEFFMLKPNNLAEFISYSPIVTCSLAGYYLDKIEDKKFGKAMALLGIAGLTMLVFSIVLDFKRFNATGNYSEFGRYQFFLACFIYLLVKKLCEVVRIDERMNVVTSKILYTISGATMLAFVISAIVIWRMDDLIYYRLEPYMNKDFACEILVLATIIVSLVIGIAIRMIPGAKKYV